MLKKLIFASVLMAIPGLAFAADLPVRSQLALKAPPLQQQAFSWTGFYIGGNIGGAFDNSNRIDESFGGAGSLSLRGTGSGVAAGGQAGYNYEFALGNLSGIVIGLEADAAYTDLSAHTTVDSSVITRGSTLSDSSHLDYLGTIRGRLGYAYDRFLVYGTGGLAYGTDDHDVSRVSRRGRLLETDDITSTEIGFAYGAGFEYALPIDTYFHLTSTSAVTVGAEYLRYDLGRANETDTDRASTASDKLRDVGNIARARINYKF
jgi:outer membrane immunogenic protein